MKIIFYYTFNKIKIELIFLHNLNYLENKNSIYLLSIEFGKIFDKIKKHCIHHLIVFFLLC